MTRRFLIGISCLALATGTAWAQTSTFSQVGSQNKATVDNLAPGNVGNESHIVQNGDFNTALVFQRGLDNSSTIRQFGTANEAAHGQYSGNRNRAETDQGVRSGASDDQNSVVRQSGDDNTATILQDGRQNSSTVDQGVGIVSGAVENRSTARNRVTIDQAGGGLLSTVGQRGVSPASAPASDNFALVRQRSASQFTQVQQISTVTQTSRGNRAEVYQFEGSTAAPNNSSVEQRNTVAAAGNPSTANSASIAQRGQGNRSTVVQDGLRNLAEVTMQDGGTAALGNQASVTQSGTDLVAQTVSSGASNMFEVEQVSTASGAVVWQQRGSSSNSATVRQGTGASNLPVNGLPSDPTVGSASSSMTASVTQGGSLNRAALNQDGVSLQGYIEQFGSGLADPAGATGTAGTFQNRATIQQTGSGHYALARQASNVGASGGTSAGITGPASGPGEVFGTAGGRRSAEIIILQSNSGNYAAVQQFGQGQYGRIEQSGTGGHASIVQTMDATNATAIIYQLGTNNSYELVQAVPGAYVRVTQTGTGNAATNVVSVP